MSGLVGKSLVVVDHSLSPPRYRLLESVREFASNQLRISGKERGARDAHLAHVIRMAEVTHEDMLGDRMRERNIGGDYHQHHFADMYIGLALFRRGDLALAASQWLESMRNAIVVGHYRGAAGAIEGSAYISGQMGQSERCCRLLSAAAEIRTRSQMPLYSFRYLHNEEANAAARSSLGQQRYQEAFAEGARMRQEDVVNEALGLLREFSTSGP